MNAMTEVRPETLAEQMVREGVHQVRYYRCTEQFTVEMFDGRTGQASTIRAAIDGANHERLAS